MLKEHAPRFAVPTWTHGGISGLRALLLDPNDGPDKTAPTPPTTTPAPPPAAPPPSTPPVDVSALQAQLTAQQKELDATKKRAGDLEADAALGKSWRESESARIETEKAKLPKAQQELLDKMPSIELKGRLLGELLAAKAPATTAPATPPPTAPAPGGPPPQQPPIDFAAAFNDGAKWEDAKKRDPDGAEKFVAERMRPVHARRQPLMHLPRARVGEKK